MGGSTTRQVLAQIVDGAQIATGIIDSTKFKSPLSANVTLANGVQLLLQDTLAGNALALFVDGANDSVIRAAGASIGLFIDGLRDVTPVIFRTGAAANEAFRLLAPSAILQFPAKAVDPALSARGFWYRSDLDQLRRSPDGVLVEQISDLLFGSNPAQVAQAQGTTLFYSFGSPSAIDSTETPKRARMTKSGTIRNLRVISGANTLSVAAVVTVLKNGVATALTVTIPAGSNAEFTDLADSFPVVAGDGVDLQIAVAAGAGSLNMSQWSVELD